MFHVKHLFLVVASVVVTISGMDIFTQGQPDLFSLMGHVFMFIVNLILILVFVDCLISALRNRK